MSIQIPNYLDEANSAELQTSPARLMAQAAQQIPAKTQGKVEAKVFSLNPGGGTLFRHTFYLIVPAADDYTDPLFYAWHNADLYPAYLLFAGGRQGRDEKACETSHQFTEEMERLFDRSETRKLMLALADLADSREGNVQEGQKNRKR